MRTASEKIIDDMNWYLWSLSKESVVGNGLFADRSESENLVLDSRIDEFDDSGCSHCVPDLAKSESGNYIFSQTSNFREYRNNRFDHIAIPSEFIDFALCENSHMLEVNWISFSDYTKKQIPADERIIA